MGSLEDKSVRAVISTLLSIFEFCRGFRDPLDTEEPANLVFYLTSQLI